MLVPCLVMQYLLPFLVLESSHCRKENGLFTLLVFLMPCGCLVICVASLWWHWLVCNVSLWHFPVIFAYFLIFLLMREIKSLERV